MSSQPVQQNVSRATYPLPQPLVMRFKRGGLQVSPSTTTSSSPRPAVESIQEALTHLVGNAIESMDTMYFSTPPRLRKHPAFQHRLCLRIRADPQERTLSLTDLGSGMTRADLINTLGMGKSGMTAGQGSTKGDSAGDSKDETTDEDEWDTEGSEDDDDEGEGEDAGEVEEEENESSEQEKDDGDENDVSETNGETAENGAVDAEQIPIEQLSCRQSDIGGFYAALCSLGTGVRVGTKVCGKFG